MKNTVEYEADEKLKPDNALETGIPSDLLCANRISAFPAICGNWWDVLFTA